jgi:hypothetical protein
MKAKDYGVHCSIKLSRKLKNYEKEEMLLLSMIWFSIM